VATGDLTSVVNVQAQAGMKDAAAAVLATLITQASSFIATATDRSFSGTVSKMEIRNGSGGTELFLADGPVASITSLSIDAKPIPAQPADGQPGYFLVNSELLCLSGYVFTKGHRNVRVAYAAGYTATPKDVEQACVELVVSAYRRVPRGPDMQSETIPASGAVVSFSLKDVPAYAARVIDQYRKVVPL
jgi:hypothetical protein